ncbi:hypothetical protein [Bacillus wiedmannii]|uniref:hypothetical protein n=1 Tax=Bacillus wiedmannii TaxID=1890302 RepID=UPI000BF1AEC8|nr:hypothetical protein [Bacillus wiedmannii]PEJ48427.1 hypothetical protein CN672_13875 [Bacillus wiedmannii]PEM10287.1 hypothetical protein CN610_13955 [Bacillus wiedmannii]PHD09529.1 hypothetical protein COF45_17695 [Bacillus wiedmannii]
MANKQRGMVDIRLDKKRKLHYNLNALAEIEDALGVKIHEMHTLSLGMKNIRTILWAGLIHEDAELTEETVGSLVDVSNIAEVQTKVQEAFVGGESKN